MSRFVISTELAAINEKQQPVFTSDGLPVYETNYFCRKATDIKTGIAFIEWDTDINFAQKFNSKPGAEKYAKDKLSEIENCQAVELFDYPTNYDRKK